MKVFLCDDEPLAIERLETLLEDFPDVECVASTSDPREAMRLIGEANPDLLLLDVQMPGIDGFDIVERVAKLRDAAPLIAFVTAYKEFAHDAYECGAIDFLPKPVRASRLAATIDRANEALSGREARARLSELESRLGDLRAESLMSVRAHVWVSRRGETIRVNLDSIRHVFAEGAYVRLHVGEQSYLHREPIGALAARLDEARFLRVHRSHIVRIDQVAMVRRTLHGSGELLLHDGERIPLGRKFSSAVRQRLTKGRAPG